MDHTDVGETQEADRPTQLPPVEDLDPRILDEPAAPAAGGRTGSLRGRGRSTVTPSTGQLALGLLLPSNSQGSTTSTDVSIRPSGVTVASLMTGSRERHRSLAPPPPRGGAVPLAGPPTRRGRTRASLVRRGKAVVSTKGSLGASKPDTDSILMDMTGPMAGLVEALADIHAGLTDGNGDRVRFALWRMTTLLDTLVTHVPITIRKNRGLAPPVVRRTNEQSLARLVRSPTN